ncbi:hypothetical protein ACFS4T_27435 [Pseudomonas lini]
MSGEVNNEISEEELLNEDFFGRAHQRPKFFCQHSRVPQLQGWMTYQYKKSQRMEARYTLELYGTG